MKVDREREYGGIAIESETLEESELLKYLWCNRVKVTAFDNKGDSVTLSFTPTFRESI